MFVVFEEAVYRHRIIGVFDSQGGAEDRARAESMSNPMQHKNVFPGDGHHNYVVGRLPLNETVDDVAPICSFNKGVRKELL